MLSPGAGDALEGLADLKPRDGAPQAFPPWGSNPLGHSHQVHDLARI